MLAAETGATLSELMGRLGHSTPATAMRYQHAAQGRDREIASLLSIGRRVTELPVMPVYCQGPPEPRYTRFGALLDEPRARFIVAAYVRAHATPTSTSALWMPERACGGVQLRPVDQVVPRPDGSLALRFHHWCELCRFDGEYNAEPFTGAVFGVLNAAWFSGRTEIEVREFDRVCRPRMARE